MNHVKTPTKIQKESFDKGESELGISAHILSVATVPETCAKIDFQKLKLKKHNITDYHKYTPTLLNKRFK